MAYTIAIGSAREQLAEKADLAYDGSLRDRSISVIPCSLYESPRPLSLIFFFAPSPELRLRKICGSVALSCRTVDGCMIDVGDSWAANKKHEYGKVVGFGSSSQIKLEGC
ncbi:hypothetical protein ACLOJK_028732 [Asimina triloba]